VGGDIDIAVVAGKSALDVATDYGKQDCVSLLGTIFATAS
jgi:hypothetical protein